jgi:hypothetical protein
VFCPVLEFEKEKRIFTKIEGGNVDFSPVGNEGTGAHKETRVRVPIRHRI